MAKRQIRKIKYFWVIGVISATFACLLLFLPTLLSTAPFNKTIINALNRQVAPGQVTIEDISLGWFSHQHAKSVHYVDEKAGIEADLSALTIEKNLLQLLFHRTGLGFIHLESPRVVVPIKKITDFEADRSEDEAKPDDDKRARDQVKPLGQKLLAWGSVSFINGQIFGMTNSGEEVLLLDQVLFQTDISKENSQAIARLSAKSGRDEGKMTGDVTITIPENGVIDKASFVGYGHLTVTNWNLEELLPLAALFSDQIPFGRGRLDGEWRMENPSDKELKITGDFKATDVHIYGGLLKKDQPKISQIGCQLNVFRQEGEWSLKKLQFTSPLASGTASGVGKEEVTIDTRVNIVPTLKQLPNTLNIRDDLQITNGSIKVSGKVALTDAGTHFDGRLTLSRLEGQQARRKFAWKKPLTITGEGRYKDDRWAIDQARIASTFINGEVRATPDKFESRLIVDAAKTFKQAGQIFKLPPIMLQGLMKAHWTGEKKGRSWDLHIDTSSDALAIHSEEKVLSAAAPFKLQATSQYQIENRRHLLTAPQLSIKSDLLSGIYTADQIELLPGGRMVKIENATADGKIDNGKLGAVYAAIESIQPKLMISGKTHYEAAFGFEQDQINVHNISLTTTPFKVDNGRQQFFGQKLILSTAGAIDVDKRSAVFAPVNITATGGEATFESFKIGNLQEPLDDMTAKGSVKFDLARLTAMDGTAEAQHPSLVGNGEAMFEWVWRNGVLTAFAAKGIVAPLQWNFDDTVKIDEPKVVVDLEMGPGKNNNSAIKRLLIKSNFVSLNGKGSFHPNTPKAWLRFKGNVDADLEKLSHLLSGMVDQPIVLTGKKEAPFTLKVARKNDPQKSWLHMLGLKMQFPANRMTTMGVTLDQFKMPTELQEGQAHLNLKAAVNGGKITLAPSVNLNEEPRLTVGKGMVLKNVRITQSMVDKLLTKLHPIFVGATAGQGAVDLYLEKLDWPLTDKMNLPLICDGQLTLNQVALESAGLLEELLSLLKADRRNLAIATETLTFSCKDGRVVTSPLTLIAEDITIILEGSMGFDQSLDFMAKTPITEKMVSDKVYPYVAESMLVIPIGGTATDPKINTDQFYAELENLVKEAGGKAIKKEAEDFIKEKAEGLLEQIFK